MNRPPYYASTDELVEQERTRAEQGTRNAPQRPDRMAGAAVLTPPPMFVGLPGGAPVDAALRQLELALRGRHLDDGQRARLQGLLDGSVGGLQ